MPEALENYVSRPMSVAFRSQAWKVWAISSIVVFLWAAIIVAAPLLKANGFDNISSPLYRFFSYICHQLNDRSFHVEGEKFAVCARCFGVYFGIFAGFVAYPFWRNVDEIEPLPRIWLFLSLIPISIDWLLTVFGIWENTHLSRFITGTILGVACATFIIPSLVEITRNFTKKRFAREIHETHKK